MIPDAAVEAAVERLLNGELGDTGNARVVRAILEAAAPHLMAQAWDEGADEAWSVSSESFNGEYPDAGEPFTAVANPYRTTK